MRVVNIRKEEYDVYIGRGSGWGNPFVIGKDGNREEVINKFLDLMLERMSGSEREFWLGELEKLEGKTLGCFCSPLPCHGDVIVSLFSALKERNIL